MDEDSPSSAPPREVLRHPAFAFFWTATTLRAFGSTIAGVAFQVLIVTVIGATPGQVGILNALSVVPYLFSVWSSARGWIAGDDNGLWW